MHIAAQQGQGRGPFPYKDPETVDYTNPNKLLGCAYYQVTFKKVHFKCFFFKPKSDLIQQFKVSSYGVYKYFDSHIKYDNIQNFKIRLV